MKCIWEYVNQYQCLEVVVILLLTILRIAKQQGRLGFQKEIMHVILKKQKTKNKHKTEMGGKNSCWMGSQKMYIKQYTLNIVQARNDRKFNLYTWSRNREKWKVLKVSTDWFWQVWKSEKWRMTPSFVVWVNGNLVV